MKLKAAIIGYGYWGPKLARNFLNSSKFQINYVVDNKPNNLIKAKNEIPLAIGLNNLDKIKAENLDLIILSTPTITHFKLVKKFLKFTNVLVEKPLSLNLKHTRELEKIAKKSKNLLFVDYPFIFSGSTNYIKKIIKNNELGKLLEIESYREQAPIRNDCDVIWDLGVHDLSILRYLLNRNPLKIHSQKYKTGNQKKNDTAYINLEYSNNLKVFIKNSWISPVKTRVIKFKFSKGILICDENEALYKIKIYKKLNLKNTNYKLEIPEIDLTEPLLNLVNYISFSITNKKNEIYNKNFNEDITKVLQKI
jgi:predicted dehydrogenase